MIKEPNSSGFIKDYTIHFHDVNKNKLNLMLKWRNKNMLKIYNTYING